MFECAGVDHYFSIIFEIVARVYVCVRLLTDDKFPKPRCAFVFKINTADLRHT